MPRFLPSLKQGFRNLATTVETETASSQLNTSRQSVQSRILEWSRKAIDEGKPHFRVGGTEVFFPKARVILLRPNAKHTPFQAKFIVPKSFNKLDLRDYLFHLYGLRALNVTTQLLHARYTRATPVSPRYRTPQIKKMTIEMAEPFIWPEEPEDKSAWNIEFQKELEQYRSDRMRLGSDTNKPSEAFGGALGPYPETAKPFIPRFLKRRLINKKEREAKREEYLEQLGKVSKVLSKSELV
ncbi:54S ribosomal protein L41 [Kluyveromyces marxianus DMKU3-1042]|uniref:Large ribosomal subunit protein uL23m n=1 Tax=Kluyveromyces marxianus (strain DMKU3-1042 / BCC 29191 / NBRC 104275) TaxID=1003335 RepID=W0TB54_KLUMD|nr:54S ribosomal protein L41 [Kluyveromyces marxianus DMKU3-1042]BAO40842.1 54S ribosomal protein L41 [Kluyveromyces marxianus DMKU3-1042]